MFSWAISTCPCSGWCQNSAVAESMRSWFHGSHGGHKRPMIPWWTHAAISFSCLPTSHRLSKPIYGLLIFGKTCQRLVKGCQNIPQRVKTMFSGGELAQDGLEWFHIFGKTPQPKKTAKKKSKTIFCGKNGGGKLSK